MALNDTNIKSVEYLTMNYRRFARILEESMDLAFGICINEVRAFGLAEILDVFNQTLPTAYVMNTGYWPLYTALNGQPLCVCGRFGLYCRHRKSANHCIDTFGYPLVPANAVFCPKERGPIKIENYSISINIANDQNPGYVFTMLITFQVPAIQRNKRIRIPAETFTKSITARYDLFLEYYRSFFGITFQPNPVLHPAYGKYFCNLPRKPTTTLPDSTCYVVHQQQMSNATLGLSCVFDIQVINVPVHINVTQCTVMKNAQAPKKIFVNVETQTPPIPPILLPPEVPPQGEGSLEKAVEMLLSKVNNSQEANNFLDFILNIKLPSGLGLLSNSQTSYLPNQCMFEDYYPFNVPPTNANDSEKVKQDNVPQASLLTKDISTSIPSTLSNETVLGDTNINNFSHVRSERGVRPTIPNNFTTDNSSSTFPCYELFKGPPGICFQIPSRKTDAGHGGLDYEYQSKVASDVYNQLSCERNKRSSNLNHLPRGSTSKLTSINEAVATPPMPVPPKKLRRRNNSYAQAVQSPIQKPVTKPVAPVTTPITPASSAEEPKPRAFQLASFLTSANRRQLGISDEGSLMNPGAVKKYKRK